MEKQDQEPAEIFDDCETKEADLPERIGNLIAAIEGEYSETLDELPDEIVRETSNHLYQMHMTCGSSAVIDELAEISHILSGALTIEEDESERHTMARTLMFIANVLALLTHPNNDQPSFLQLN